MMDIVEELREAGEHPSRADLPFGALLRKGADTIQSLQAYNAALREGLEAMTSRYIALVDSGDAGNWNPRDEPVVQKSLALLERNKP